MSITMALGAAMSGLTTAQQGLDSVSRNISNVNTKGYTRKIFVQESQVLSGTGVGVRAKALTRNVDESLMRDIRREAAMAGDYSVQTTYYARIQDSFGTPADNSSIAHRISSLASQFETLGLDVSDITQASNTVRSAADLADQLNRMSQTIQDLRLEADRSIESDVQGVNDLLGRIDTLNAEIVRSQNTFLDSGDLEDQRDQALTDLAGYMDFSYFKRDSGEVILLTTSGGSLLDKNPVTLSHMAVTKTDAGLTYEGGNFNGITANGVDITSDFKGGTIAGYLEMRDSTLTGMQAEIDQLASQMKSELNAAHNRGTPYPELAQAFNGTRTFIDPANQQISLGSGDVQLVLYNADGTQAAQSSLKTELGGSTGTINDVVGALNSFFSTYNGSAVTWASVDADGHVAIEIPSTETVGFAMRDEDATKAPSDIQIAYDSNGDGLTDQSVKGFSNFFGLNDFYVNDDANYLYDSKVVSKGWKASTTTGMEFGTTGTPSIATIAIGPQDSIQSIAAKINADPDLAAANITASVVNEGSGVRLRILQNDGKELNIAETTNAGVLSRIGLAPSSSGASTDMKVRDDLFTNPALLSSGVLQRNADTGQYSLGSGDNSIANAMAKVFDQAATFGEAGNLAGGSQTFSQYAAAILSQSSSAASRMEGQSVTQKTLLDSLTLKQGQVSGVNLDEELTQLIIYQQAYSAAARVITTSTTLFDILNNIKT
jgi:flagellar hook-associated protein 1 FlgK